MDDEDDEESEGEEDKEFLDNLGKQILEALCKVIKIKKEAPICLLSLGLQKIARLPMEVCMEISTWTKNVL